MHIIVTSNYYQNYSPSFLNLFSTCLELYFFSLSIFRFIDLHSNVAAFISLFAMGNFGESTNICEEYVERYTTVIAVLEECFLESQGPANLTPETHNRCACGPLSGTYFSY